MEWALQARGSGALACISARTMQAVKRIVVGYFDLKAARMKVKPVSDNRTKEIVEATVKEVYAVIAKVRGKQSFRSLLHVDP